MWLEGNKIKYDHYKNDYNILVYIDSTACTECALRLRVWSDILAKLNSEDNISVGLIMIISKKEIDDVSEVLKKYSFNLPIICDYDDIINQQYDFPKDPKFRGFLLNSEGMVEAVGNPSISESVASLFSHIILGEDVFSNDVCSDSIEVSERLLYMGIIAPGEIKRQQVSIFNNGESDLVISRYETS